MLRYWVILLTFIIYLIALPIIASETESNSDPAELTELLTRLSENGYQKDQPDEVVFVLAGGWKSCQGNSPIRMWIYDQFLNLKANVRQNFPNVTVSYVMTCAGLLSPFPGHPIWYVTSDSPNYVVKTDSSALGSIVQSFVKRREHKKLAVYFIGHSHGGWLALKAVQWFDLENIRGIFAIGPISAKLCGVPEYVANRRHYRTGQTRHTRRRGLLFGSFYVHGCRHAPTDVDYRNVLEKVGFLLNIYQTQGPLHATRILPDTRMITNLNRELWQGDWSHHRLGFNPITWSDICRVVHTDLGKAEYDFTCNSIQVDTDGRHINGTPTSPKSTTRTRRRCSRR